MVLQCFVEACGLEMISILGMFDIFGVVGRMKDL